MRPEEHPAPPPARVLAGWTAQRWAEELRAAADRTVDRSAGLLDDETVDLTADGAGVGPPR